MLLHGPNVLGPWGRDFCQYSDKGRTTQVKKLDDEEEIYKNEIERIVRNIDRRKTVPITPHPVTPDNISIIWADDQRASITRITNGLPQHSRHVNTRRCNYVQQSGKGCEVPPELSFFLCPATTEQWYWHESTWTIRLQEWSLHRTANTKIGRVDCKRVQNRKATGMVFLDVARLFDWVVNKMVSAWYHEITYRLIIGDKRSEPRRLEAVVSKCPVLGPYLYSVYCFPKTTRTSIALYVDEYVVIYKHRDPGVI